MNQDDLGYPFPPGQLPVKKKHKWIKWVALAVGVIFIAMVALAVYLTMAPSSILKANISIGVRSGIEVGGGSEPGISDDATGYATFEELIKGEDLFKGYDFVSDVLAEQSVGDETGHLYFVDTGNEGGGVLTFRVVKVNEVGGIFYDNAGRFAYVDLSKKPGPPYYTYETEEAKIGGHLVNCLAERFADQSTTFPYFGASDNPAVKNMTILGLPPTDVVECDYEGHTYYRWYYDESAGFLEYLEDDPNFDFGGFTVAQMIDVLDIKVSE